MTVLTFIALIVIVPILMVPVILVWYLNIGGTYKAFQAAREKSTARKQVVQEAEVE